MKARLPLALLSGLAALCLIACSSGERASESGGMADLPPLGEGDAAFYFEGPPDGWRTGTSNARGMQNALWELVADAEAPSPPNAFSLVDARGHVGQQFNLTWPSHLSMKDVDVTVAVRVSGGEEDQGGGPAWRIYGANDYYAARWNPLEDNFRVYSVVGGERLQLDSARVHADVDEWHWIRVRQVGPEITCWLDGEELLHASDTKLPGPGSVGLWTKADATTHFDDLVVRKVQ